MNRSILILALLATLTLAACDRKSTVVIDPTKLVVVPGFASPQGASGSEGATSGKGAAGKSGDGTTVTVMPPASAPVN